MDEKKRKTESEDFMFFSDELESILKKLGVWGGDADYDYYEKKFGKNKSEQVAPKSDVDHCRCGKHDCGGGDKAYGGFDPSNKKTESKKTFEKDHYASQDGKTWTYTNFVAGHPAEDVIVRIDPSAHMAFIKTINDDGMFRAHYKYDVILPDNIIIDSLTKEVKDGIVRLTGLLQDMRDLNKEIIL